MTFPEPSSALTINRNVAVRDNVPEDAVIVTVALPTVAELEAVSVNELLFPVVEAGLNVAVTPLGNPLAPSDTLPVNPPKRAISRAADPLAPGLIVRLEGCAEIEKSGCVPAPTVSAIVAVLDNVPEVAVTVTLLVPKVAVLDALKVNVALSPVVDGGVNVAVTPVGRPLTENDTLPVNPPVRVTAIDAVAVAPRSTEALPGVAEMEKLGLVLKKFSSQTIA